MFNHYSFSNQSHQLKQPLRMIFAVSLSIIMLLFTSACGGGSGTSTSGVEISDDTPSGATFIALNVSALGAIDQIGDHDYWLIEVTEPGTIVIQTTGSLSTVGQLEDTDGNILTVNSGSGIGGNFKINHTVTAGSYYIRVSGLNDNDTGDYILRITDNNTPSGAFSIAINTTTESQLLEPMGDFDYWRIDITESGTLSIQATGSTDTFGQLEDGDGNVLASDNDSGSDDNFRIDRLVTIGTYYIRVTEFNDDATGNYIVHFGFSADGATGDNTRGGAKTIALNYGSDHFLRLGDVNYWRFEVPASGTLRIQTTDDIFDGSSDGELATGNIVAYGQLEDANGNILATDSGSGTDFNFRMDYAVNAGTYYVRVSELHNDAEIDDYILHVGFTDDTATFQHTREGAQNLRIGSSNSGGDPFLLGNPSVEYWRIIAPGGGGLTITSNGVSVLGFTTQLEDSAGNILAVTTDDGDNMLYDLIINSSTYYLVVNYTAGSPSDRYTLNTNVSILLAP